MADRNDILEEQRKAREEFLRLKKMQSGEIDAGPKPSEVAYVPKTPKEKLANFWFQYKWHTIAIVVSLIVLTVLVAQCANRPVYDLEMVYFTYKPVLDDQTAEISEYFEELAKDLDGNGEVNVQVINCSLSDSSRDVQYRNTMLTKLQSIIAADEKALLFITDEKSIEYFNNIAKESGGLFEEEPLKLGEEFYEKTKTEAFGSLPEGLQISCRKISDTVLEKKSEIKKYKKESERILALLKESN